MDTHLLHLTSFLKPENLVPIHPEKLLGYYRGKDGHERLILPSLLAGKRDMNEVTKSTTYESQRQYLTPKSFGKLLYGAILTNISTVTIFTMYNSTRGRLSLLIPRLHNFI